MRSAFLSNRNYSEAFSCILHDIDIVVDIDQTLFPLLRSMQQVPGGERIVEDCSRWDGLAELCDRPVHEVIQEALKPELALSVGLYPGAYEALRGWKQDGFRVAIATHRYKQYRPETEEFLRGVGLGDFPLWVDADLQKTSLLREGGVLIDDAPHVLSGAKQKGFHAATLWHHYNAQVVSHYKIPAARTWSRLQKHVEHLHLQSSG